ncbi:MAG: hypothetical protein SFU91_08260 [Chloroherpetonaceae bacterium]|nr:hypothetical protein [Chloroherpetonaceae bacterium]
MSTSLIDNLTYNYVNGRNQLTHITDAATGSNSNEGVRTGQLSNNYAYDGNGNLTRDNAKGITSIQYDWRNYFNRKRNTILKIYFSPQQWQKILRISNQ